MGFDHLIAETSTELKRIKKALDWTIAEYLSDPADAEDYYEEILEDLETIRTAIKCELAVRWGFCSRDKPNKNVLILFTPLL